MYADKDVAPGPRPPRRRAPAFRFLEIRFGVRLFGSSNGRAFRATTPELMNCIDSRSSEFTHLNDLAHRARTGGRTDQVSQTTSNKGHKE